MDSEKMTQIQRNHCNADKVFGSPRPLEVGFRGSKGASAQQYNGAFASAVRNAFALYSESGR